MNRIRWFARLAGADRGRLARTLLLAALVRLALWVLPFRLVRALAARLIGPASKATEPNPARRDFESATAARVVWAVGRACRFVPAATCLVRAMTAQVLLAREGVVSTLRFGVGRGNGRAFRAHAWLECAGRVVIGGDEDLGDFAPLPHFPWAAGGSAVRG